MHNRHVMRLQSLRRLRHRHKRRCRDSRCYIFKSNYHQFEYLQSASKSLGSVSSNTPSDLCLLSPRPISEQSGRASIDGRLSVDDIAAFDRPSAIKEQSLVASRIFDCATIGALPGQPHILSKVSASRAGLASISPSVVRLTQSRPDSLIGGLDIFKSAESTSPDMARNKQKRSKSEDNTGPTRSERLNAELEKHASSHSMIDTRQESATGDGVGDGDPCGFERPPRRSPLDRAAEDADGDRVAPVTIFTSLAAKPVADSLPRSALVRDQSYTGTSAQTKPLKGQSLKGQVKISKGAPSIDVLSGLPPPVINVPNGPVDQANLEVPRPAGKRRKVIAKTQKAMRKSRRIVLRKPVLVVILGRQLAGPTSRLLETICDGGVADMASLDLLDALPEHDV
jgi:hypothetical protein